MAFTKRTVNAGFDDKYLIDEKTFPNWNVANCRVLTSTTAVFTFKTGVGIDLYNCRYVQSNGKAFISPSQTQGKDGKYYKNYGFYLSDEFAKVIMAELDKELS